MVGQMTAATYLDRANMEILIVIHIGETQNECDLRFKLHGRRKGNSLTSLWWWYQLKPLEWPCSSSPLNHGRSLTLAGCLSLLAQFRDESMETNYNAVGNRVKQVSLWFVNREQLLLLIFPGPGRQPGLNVETSLMLLLFGMLVALWLTNAEALIWTRGTILSGWLLILGTSYGLCGLGIALPRPECHLFWRCPPPYHLQR
jgi:hypothetical protein